MEPALRDVDAPVRLGPFVARRRGAPLRGPRRRPGRCHRGAPLRDRLPRLCRGGRVRARPPGRPRPAPRAGPARRSRPARGRRGCGARRMGDRAARRPGQVGGDQPVPPVRPGGRRRQFLRGRARPHLAHRREPPRLAPRRARHRPVRRRARLLPFRLEERSCGRSVRARRRPCARARLRPLPRPVLRPPDARTAPRPAPRGEGPLPAPLPRRGPARRALPRRDRCGAPRRAGPPPPAAGCWTVSPGPAGVCRGAASSRSPRSS